MGEINFFAETNYRNQKTKFGIKTRDRRRHFYVIGKTGMGKTTMLENMAIQDIRDGKGLGVVDPHGEFAQKLLDYIPSHRINDVVYFNPADINYPIAFNAVEKVDPEHRHLVTSGLIGIFKKIWAESWGPRLEYLLRNAILALLEYPGSTLLSIMRMLSDKEYRKKVVEKVEDPVVKSFWTEEFAKYPDRFMTEAVAPIQNKVGQFLTAPLIRNIVGQTKSAIDMRKIMDNKKILIMNLSKGALGEDNSALMGAMLITRLQLAAMSRVDISEEERQDFYLYVDEFQNFATEAFASILSEARKYRLNLILAHQYVAQMEESVRDAVFGNVGTMATFRVGAYDAEYLEKEFAPEFAAQDLVNLNFKQIYIKLMIDGVASRPFSADTLPPLRVEEESYKEKIIKTSRERYATPRNQVEEKIARWSGVIAGEQRSREQIQKEFNSENQNSQNQELYDAKCSHCGKETQVKFKPDNKRPVYCPECLDLVKKEKQAREKLNQIAPKSSGAESKTIDTDKTASLENSKDSNNQNQNRSKDNSSEPKKEFITDLKSAIDEALQSKKDKK